MQPSSQVLVVVTILAVAVGAWLLLRGDGRSPEEQVRAVIDQIQDGVERSHPRDVLRHIDDDYRDAHGMDRQMLHGLLARQLIQRREVRVQRLGALRVEILDEGRATAHFTAAVSEGLSLDALRRAGAWQFEVELARDTSGDWKVTSHRRTQRR